VSLVSYDFDIKVYIGRRVFVSVFRVCECADLQANTRYTFINLPLNMFVSSSHLIPLPPTYLDLSRFRSLIRSFLDWTFQEVPHSTKCTVIQFTVHSLRYSYAKNERFANLHL